MNAALATYSFMELIERVDIATESLELALLALLIIDEKCYYSDFQYRILAEAIHIKRQVIEGA